MPDPTCSTCGEVIHRDGFVWAHADPYRVYGHVARWSGCWSHDATPEGEATDG